MAVSVDKTWINKSISEYNRGNAKTLEQLADEIIAHGRFDKAKKEFLVRHLEASSDQGGIIQTNATEIFDLFASMPAAAAPRKTLKLSGNMMTMDIDRASGKVLHPDDVVEKLLSEEDGPGGAWARDTETEKFLNANGVKCSYEYPGYFSCPCKLGDLNVGTVDGFWGADIMDKDGYSITIPEDVYVAFDQFRDKQPGEVTPDNLLNAIKQVLAWANS